MISSTYELWCLSAKRWVEAWTGLGILAAHLLHSAFNSFNLILNSGYESGYLPHDSKNQAPYPTRPLFLIQKTQKAKEMYSCVTCCTTHRRRCPVLHPASLTTRGFLRTLKVVLLQFPTFRKAPPLSPSPLGFLTAVQLWASSEPFWENLWHRSTSCRILQAMHPCNDRSGNVCQFSTAGINGSSISLPKWPAFTLRLISVMSFSWFLSDVSWQ